MFKFKIEALVCPTQKDLEDINLLLPQIAERPHLLSQRELGRIVAQNNNCKLLVARVKQGDRWRIVGMSALTFVYVPTGLLATIEDVVVDNGYRGGGIGKSLVMSMVDTARVRKAKHVSLTTSPKRAAANRMYKKLGFFKKETNYYRINLILPKPSKVTNKI